MRYLALFLLLFMTACAHAHGSAEADYQAAHGKPMPGPGLCGLTYGGATVYTTVRNEAKTARVCPDTGRVHDAVLDGSVRGLLSKASLPSIAIIFTEADVICGKKKHVRACANVDTVLVKGWDWGALTDAVLALPASRAKGPQAVP